MSQEPKAKKVTGDENITHAKTAARMSMYGRIQNACRALFITKNSQYDDAIADTGVLGATVEIIGVSRRIKTMVLKSADFGKSDKAKLADLLQDLNVYSTIALLMIADDNWRGE